MEKYVEDIEDEIYFVVDQEIPGRDDRASSVEMMVRVNAIDEVDVFVSVWDKDDGKYKKDRVRAMALGVRGPVTGYDREEEGITGEWQIALLVCDRDLNVTISEGVPTWQERVLCVDDTWSVMEMKLNSGSYAVLIQMESGRDVLMEVVIKLETDDVDDVADGESYIDK